MDLSRLDVPQAHLLAQLDVDQRVALDQGGALVITHPESQGAVLGAAWLETCREASWHLFRDWEWLGRFIPGASYRMVEQSGEGAEQRAIVHGHTRFGLMSLHYNLTVRMSGERFAQAWHLTSPDDVEGLARRHPWLRPNSGLVRGLEGRASATGVEGRTLFVYENVLTPGPMLPRAAEQFLSRRAVRMFLDKLTQHFAAARAAEPAGAGEGLPRARLQ